MNEILKELEYKLLIDRKEALEPLFKVLSESCREFIEAAAKAVKEGVQQGLKFLREVMNEVTKVCKEHKILVSRLSNLSMKAAVREGVVFSTKTAIKYGTGKAASQSVKAVLMVSNPAGFVADVAQLGCEVTGNKAVGKQVGLWGNIATGAATGGLVGGVVGAPVGALLGFASWAIGEAVGNAVENRLS